MNKDLIIAKFIEKEGLKIVLVLSVVMSFIVGLIFYFYAWQTITEASDSTSTLTSIKQTLLETVVKDMDTRSEKLGELKRGQLNIKDIFKTFLYFKMKKILVAIFLIASVFILPTSVKAVGSDFVFSEIMYDLASSDTDHEWVEVYNSGTDPVTIVEGSSDSGSWRFNEGSTNHIFTLVQGSLTVPVGGTVILAGNGAVFLTDHSGFSGTVIDTVMSLNNTSEILKLSADKGATFLAKLLIKILGVAMAMVKV